jgi:superfamily I DNA/RNA helicase
VTPTVEQEAIYAALRTTRDSLIVEARAGSGKTTTILTALAQMKEASILLVAFNKEIADTLTKRLPPPKPRQTIQARTLHSAGLQILNGLRQGYKLDRRAGELAISKVGHLQWPQRRAATKLLGCLKNTQTTPTLTDAQIYAVAGNFGILAKLNLGAAATVVAHVKRAYVASCDPCRDYDFDDMIWLPVVADMALPSRYQAILVDEAQDVNRPQLALIGRLQAPGGRTVIVGDPYQAIYGWRGAAGDEVWQTMEARGAKTLPLTTTFRCNQAIVTAAQDLVPTFRAAPQAGAGKIEAGGIGDLVRLVQGEPRTKFLLSRNNADLLTVALKLWSAHVPMSFIGGTDLLAPLLELIESHLNVTSPKAFIDSLLAWEGKERGRAEKAGAVAWIEQIGDQVKTLRIAIGHTGDPRKVPGLLVDLFSAGARDLDPTVLRLSTVHKAKGLEADAVFLLRETFARHAPPPFPDAPKVLPSQEELNIEYVAITRARHRLIWVSRSTGSPT